MNDPHIDAAPTSIRAYARRRCRHLHLAVNSPPETLSVRLLNAITKNRMKTPLIQYVCSNKSFINCISILSVISGVKYCATRVLDSPTHPRLSLSNFVNAYVLFVLCWLLKKVYIPIRERSRNPEILFSSLKTNLYLIFHYLFFGVSTPFKNMRHGKLIPEIWN